MIPFFGGPGLDRADPLRWRPEEIDRLRTSPAARCLQWHDGAPAIGDDGALQWGPCTDDAPLFLGFDAERRPCFSIIPPGAVPSSARAHWHLLERLDVVQAPIFAAALSLANWHRRHGYCANCGSATRPDRGGWSRACPVCGAEHYPRVDPVVIMTVEHDGRLLLGRQPAFPAGRFSALAGFVEPGESIEAAVARELAEEVGVTIGTVRYRASQPWPFPSSLMIGAHAVATRDELTIDHGELDDARWFTREEVHAALAGSTSAAFEAPPRFAIARSLIEAWADGLK